MGSGGDEAGRGPRVEGECGRGNEREKGKGRKENEEGEEEMEMAREMETKMRMEIQLAICPIGTISTIRQPGPNQATTMARRNQARAGEGAGLAQAVRVDLRVEVGIVGARMMAMSVAARRENMKTRSGMPGGTRRRRRRSGARRVKSSTRPVDGRHRLVPLPVESPAGGAAATAAAAATVCPGRGWKGGKPF